MMGDRGSQRKGCVGRTNLRVGKRVRGALYVHRRATAFLADDMAVVLATAVVVAPRTRWNVARLGRTSVCLLEYEDFDEAAFPRLLASTLVDLVGGRSVSRDHRHVDNPPILHRKELLVAPDDPRRPVWAALTADLVAKGLFADVSRIGRRAFWTASLAAAGLDSEGRVA